jgi:polysaccharide biosynthesis/export protein
VKRILFACVMSASLGMIYGPAWAQENTAAASTPPNPAEVDANFKTAAEVAAETKKDVVESGKGYLVGINDMLTINVMEPEKIELQTRVGPDGTISFPYIGSVLVKGLNIPQIQKKIQSELANGYLKFPVVVVGLKESNSKLYMVYGEVNRPGSYPLEDYSTVMRAISVAQGFTKYGNSSRVKILRPRGNSPGYDTIKIDMNKVIGGDSTEDVQLKAGDMVVVSEGVF